MIQRSDISLFYRLMARLWQSKIFGAFFGFLPKKFTLIQFEAH